MTTKKMQENCVDNNKCHFTTCRFNEDGKCTNEEFREECVDMSRKVLCVDGYRNSKLCKGFGSEYKPCEYMDKCDLKTCYGFDTRFQNNNELHKVFGLAITCKRDNPNFKPLSIDDFTKEYRKYNKDFSKYDELLKEAIKFGVVKE